MRQYCITGIIYLFLLGMMPGGNMGSVHAKEAVAYFGTSDGYTWDAGEVSHIGFYLESSTNEDLEYVRFLVEYDPKVLELSSSQDEGITVVEEGKFVLERSGDLGPVFKQILYFKPLVSAHTGIEILSAEAETSSGPIRTETEVYTEIDIPVEPGCRLTGLFVDGVEIEGFHPDTMSYEISSAGEKEPPVISVETADGTEAAISDDELVVGRNTIYITTTNRQGQKALYTIYMDRAAEPLAGEAVAREGSKEIPDSADEIPLDSIISQETQINNPIHIEADVDGACLEFNVGHKTKHKKADRFYYVPITGIYYKDKALFVRGNVHQNYTLVVRDRDPIEYEAAFLQMEGKWNSFLLYWGGRIRRFCRNMPLNLYYEKNSMKAEEGTFEIFLQALQSDRSKNYFILDSTSPQWETLSKYPNVAAKYSKQYYELVYSADCFISTETPSHLNVHRAVNKYIRKTLLEKKFVFLQHGVTYLKCQGAGSVFGKGKEGEPDYMIVGSEKEADAAARMLNIPKERCIQTGLPVFSKIEYEHISQTSEDVVTIMLTWKPSEEHMLRHFEESGYYQNTRMVYELVQKHIAGQKIQLVPHPKVLELLLRTDLAESVWKGSVSDALHNTKLLITDYSSVCYNAFYQGAAVVFYQPDLEAYQKEVGRLVPEDDEYIGYRVFEQNGLEQLLQRGIRQGHIDLTYMRSEQFMDRYRSINQFTDGKNIQRIVDFLKEKGIV